MYKYFTEIDLPQYDIQKDLDQMIASGKINWGIHNQISLTSLPGKSHDFHLATGSLVLNWDDAILAEDGSFNKINTKQHVLNETDFTELCDVFKNTVFEDLYRTLTEKYIVGRVRIMQLSPKTCLSWHVDSSKRLHYPIQTHEGCFMVIEDEIKHLEQCKWYMTDTTSSHTVFNGSLRNRIHLVAAILGEIQ